MAGRRALLVDISTQLHLQRITLPSKTSRLFATRQHPDTVKTSDSEFETARTWLATFKPASISRKIGELSYSRSSGPGGQNVNKYGAKSPVIVPRLNLIITERRVNSKATLKIPLQSILDLVPAVLHSSLRDSPFYAAKSQAFVIQSDDSRRQAENAERCYAKLYNSLTNMAQSRIPGETSEAQKGKVSKL